MTTRLGKLLEENAGISPNVLGDKNLARAVRERMSACRLANEEQYFEKAQSSPHEMEALIEAVVVPETSFFRDRGPFDFLGRYVHDAWAPARRAAPLRILSAPSSSGEEPYSIAIVLQEAGVKPGEYAIDALDISRVLLRKAERATYSQHSFRGVPLALRDRYFVPAGRDFVLKDTIRQGVQFMRGNLIDEHILWDKPPYDIVFCRNLLIYLGAGARARVVRNIERLMTRNGLLFVGHAETSCFPAVRFVPAGHRGAFAFRRIDSGAAAVSVIANGGSHPVVFTPPCAEITPQAPAVLSQAAVPPHDIPGPEDSLEEARQLADRGLLSDAAAMCERVLLADKTNADAYCLLGAVMEGLENLRRAEECFTRAIYLNGCCYDAVVHLSLIKEHRGDVAGAEVLRRRAARMQPQART